MIDQDDLQRQAREDCLKHAEALLKGAFTVELGASAVHWSAVELRRIFEQPMVLWRRFGGFDVILDAGGRPVGYVDESQWHGCAWEPLDYHEVLGLVRQTPLALPKLVIERMGKGDQDCHEVVLKQVVEEGPPARWLCRINGIRRTIISLEPIVEGHDGARG